MKKQKSIAANAALNAFKTLLSIIFPLITYPYVTRVLKAANLGKVTYAQSIVSYFALIAALGINTYAVREGSRLKNDPRRLGQFCNEVFSVNIITTVISYALLALCVFASKKLQAYSELIGILSITIIMTTAAVEWVNVIFEDYWIITVRSIVVQLINIVMLFVLVKSEQDYFKYAFLIVLANGITGVWNYLYCRRYIRLRFTIHAKFSEHIRPLLVFFANNLAISVYCYSDTTMLGWMVGDKPVGVYSVAVKAYTVIKTVLASVYTVCIPRLSNYYGQDDKKGFYDLVNDVLGGLILIAIPAMVGIWLLAEPIVMFLGGNEYLDAVPTLRILSVALGFAIIGGIFSNCINIPSGKEKITLIGTFAAALSNIVLNIFFIPWLGQHGAAITTAIAEALVLLVCFFGNRDIKKMIYRKKLAVDILQSLIGCVSAVVGYLIAKTIADNMFIICFITVAWTCIMYLTALVLLKNRYVYMVINRVKKKI